MIIHVFQNIIVRIILTINGSKKMKIQENAVILSIVNLYNHHINYKLLIYMNIVQNNVYKMYGNINSIFTLI